MTGFTAEAVASMERSVMATLGGPELAFSGCVSMLKVAQLCLERLGVHHLQVSVQMRWKARGATKTWTYNKDGLGSKPGSCISKVAH